MISSIALITLCDIQLNICSNNDIYVGINSCLLNKVIIATHPSALFQQTSLYNRIFFHINTYPLNILFCIIAPFYNGKAFLPYNECLSHVHINSSSHNYNKFYSSNDTYVLKIYISILKFLCFPNNSFIYYIICNAEYYLDPLRKFI